jgi:hypothetical protein
MCCAAWAWEASTSSISGGVKSEANCTAAKMAANTGIFADGTIAISCVYAGTAMAKYPICGGGPIDRIPVRAGQTLNGVINFQP